MTLPSVGRVTPWHRRWILDAPGVKTGFYSWAKRKDEKEAHCYRLGTRTVEGLCGYHFGRQVCVPALDDRVCRVCEEKARAMEVELFGKSLHDKVRINDPHGRYQTEGPYGPLPRLGRKLRRLFSKDEKRFSRSN